MCSPERHCVVLIRHFRILLAHQCLLIFYVVQQTRLQSVRQNKQKESDPMITTDDKVAYLDLSEGWVVVKVGCLARVINKVEQHKIKDCS